MIDLASLPKIVMAIGGLGMASYGLVDATKMLWGGANRIGFGGIVATIQALTPPAAADAVVNALPASRILCTLRANWFNGTDLGSQKAIAKSLIKLYLNSSNAADLAKEAGVDPALLTQVAAAINSGSALTALQNDVYARFDLILTARLDETFQQADQIYRNGTRTMAAVFAIGLAIVAAYMLHGPGSRVSLHEIGTAILCGLLAGPLAPIAKDVSTALQTAVNTLQLVKK